jgi:hypothetical protein
VRAALAIVASLLLAGCELLEDANKAPWQGFATNKRSGRLEWWFIGKSSYRDCIEMMQWETSGDRVNAQWYRAPLGCGYAGNNYWRVWLMNEWSGHSQDFECIARSFNPANTAEGARYSPLLKGSSRQSDSYRCE